MNKLPKTGRPRGPGMGIGPALLRPFFQARPPEVKAQVSRVRVKKAMKRETKIEISRRFLDRSNFSACIGYLSVKLRNGIFDNPNHRFTVLTSD